MKSNSESIETPIYVYWPVSVSQYFYLCLCVCVSVSFFVAFSLHSSVCLSLGLWTGAGTTVFEKEIAFLIGSVETATSERKREKNGSSQRVENSFSV